MISELYGSPEVTIYAVSRKRSCETLVSRIDMVDLTSLKRDSRKYSFRLRFSLATFPRRLSILDRLDFRKQNSVVSRKNKMQTDRARRICTEIKKRREKAREKKDFVSRRSLISMQIGRNGSRYRPFCASLAPDITENMHLARHVYKMVAEKKKRSLGKNDAEL